MDSGTYDSVKCFVEINGKEAFIRQALLGFYEQGNDLDQLVTDDFSAQLKEVHLMPKTTVLYMHPILGVFSISTEKSVEFINDHGGFAVGFEYPIKPSHPDSIQLSFFYTDEIPIPTQDGILFDDKCYSISFEHIDIEQ